jgi:Transport and Golgi organisation 2
MCTVTFYKDAGKTIITSNRDEQIGRPSAAAPGKFLKGNNTFYYPVDTLTNGTWFCVKQDGGILVLLNGSERKHIPSPPYRRSRGLILLDIFDSIDISRQWQEIDLYNIEPFTIVAFVHNELMQFRWNGCEKSFRILDDNQPRIWSSATLYDNRTINMRESWYSSFLAEKKGNIHEGDFLDFHTNMQKSDSQDGLGINRNQTIITKNVTQCVIDGKTFILTHMDLITGSKSRIIEYLQ